MSAFYRSRRKIYKIRSKKESIHHNKRVLWSVFKILKVLRLHKKKIPTNLISHMSHLPVNRRKSKNIHLLSYKFLSPLLRKRGWFHLHWTMNTLSASWFLSLNKLLHPIKIPKIKVRPATTTSIKWKRKANLFQKLLDKRAPKKEKSSPRSNQTKRNWTCI